MCTTIAPSRFSRFVSQHMQPLMLEYQIRCQRARTLGFTPAHWSRLEGEADSQTSVYTASEISQTP